MAKNQSFIKRNPLEKLIFAEVSIISSCLPAVNRLFTPPFMNKKTYQRPVLQTLSFTLTRYVCGDSSIPFGGQGGTGIAEGKERLDSEDVDIDPSVLEAMMNSDHQWGGLW